MLYLVKMRDGTALWVNEEKARDLQGGNKILYVVAEKEKVTPSLAQI